MVVNHKPGLGGAKADRVAFNTLSAARQAQYAVRHTSATRSSKWCSKNELEHEPFCVTLRLIEVNARSKRRVANAENVDVDRWTNEIETRKTKTDRKETERQP
jgi:hypothetical protein